MKRGIILITIAVMLAGSPAFAQHGWRAPMAAGHGCGIAGPGCCMMGKDFIRPGMLLRWADKIGLDQNQKDKLDKLSQEHGLACIEKKAELEKAQLKLKHLRMNDGLESEILASIDRIGLLKTEMQKMKYLHRKAVKSIVTKEQLDKIKELRKECKRADRPFGRGHGNRRDDDPGQKQGKGRRPHGGRFGW